MTRPDTTMTPRIVDGISLTQQGDGDRTVLLLHGIGGNAGSWTAVGSLLATHGLRALAWDAPGYGESSDPRGPADADYPTRVLTLLDRLGTDQVDLVGTSWGGVIATVVAARAAGRVRSLVLLDSTPGSGSSPDSAAAMLARADDLAARGADAFAAARAPRLVAPGCDPAVAAAVRAAMGAVRLPGYRAAAAFMAATDTTDLLASVTSPTLVLVGEHDQVTGEAASRVLADGIPGASFHRLPGAGHAAISERPHDVAMSMLEFWGTP